MTERRLSETARATMLDAIQSADGREVFAIGSPDAEGRVDTLVVHASGQVDRVPAFVERARPGDVLIHNHPSGQLDPSDADMRVAIEAGSRGLGFWIVDNAVSALHEVVRPWVRAGFDAVLPEEIDDWLGADGRLLGAGSGFALRAPQLQMAHAVRDSLNRATLTLCEAGTGVGKSFAYLVPALAFARRNRTPVVVSTASIALQQQLWDKDLPALARLADEPPRLALLKGRGQYVSIRRALEWRESVEADAATGALTAWLDTTPDGDRAGAPPQLDDEIWEEIRSESDNCLRHRCPHFRECHFFAGRGRAAQAQVIVVNHALLAADIRVRAESGVGFDATALLPPWQHLVVDEAHGLESYVRSGFGMRSGELALQRALAGLRGRRKGKGLLERFRRRLLDLADRLRVDQVQALLAGLGRVEAEIVVVGKRSATWFGMVDDWLRAVGRDEPVEWPARDDAFPAVREAGLELVRELESLVASIERLEDGQEPETWPTVLEGVWQSVLSRARRVAGHAAAIRAVLTNASQREVAWVERAGRQRRPVFEIAPVDVAPLLDERLWRRLRSAVLTSATLATGPDDFAFVAGGLGVDAAEVPRLQLGSPFAHDDLVLLALPRNAGGAEGGDPQAVAELVVAGRGGALVLCTSFGSVRRIAAGLRGDPRLAGITILAQGEAAPSELSERFRRERDSVLVGTASFWEGFDAAGETLRHVLLVRLPFAVPGHPLAQARHRWVEARGGNSFRDLSLPEAIMRFRQGYGRLVRGPGDYGVVSVLDDRIRSRGYGRRFLAAIPASRRVEGSVEALVPQIRDWLQRWEQTPAST